MAKIIVTEPLIRAAMKGARYKSQQPNGVSLPAVQRYVDRLEAGHVPPPIKVDGDMLVEGNHRYIAGRVFGREPPVMNWAGGRPHEAISWDAVPIDPKDWGNR